MHRKGVGNKAEGYGIVESMDPFLGRAMNETVASEEKGVGAQSFRQETRKIGLEGSYYRKVFRGDGVLEYSVLSGPQLTAEERLRWEAVSREVTPHEAAQQPAIARPQSRVEYFKRLRRNNDKRDKGGSSDSSGGACSPRERERRCKRMECGV